jgi:hypothetical protein
MREHAPDSAARNTASFVGPALLGFGPRLAPTVTAGGGASWTAGGGVSGAFGAGVTGKPGEALSGGFMGPNTADGGV